MQLDLITLRAIAKGAARIEQTAEGFRFYRFTAAQEAQYATLHPDLLRKTYSTPGVCLELVTDSTHIGLEAAFAPSTTRKFYAFDIVCDGAPVASITNAAPTDPLFATDFSLAAINEDVLLPPGRKTVRLVFPWSVTPTVRAVTLDDGASVEPTPARDVMLFFGDSITHGYDALRPSETYACRIADRLGMDMVNKAIGGEVFFPELLEAADDLDPRYIAVAYGTNDWFKTDFTVFEKNCRRFYARLAEKYPRATIFALAPIWRKDHADIHPFGDFARVREVIFDAAARQGNIIPLDGYDFVPHDGDTYFSDLMLHPNTAGFAHYAQNLYAAMKPHL